MYEFRNTFVDCGLSDMGWKGHKYTWSNNQEGKGKIDERLDRFVCDSSWSSLSPLAQSYNLAITRSDHSPIILNYLDSLTSDLLAKRWALQFHLEEAWNLNPDCADVIKNRWSSSLDIVDNLNSYNLN